LAKYDIGIYNYRNSSQKWIMSCGCGTVGYSKSKPTFHYKCEGCGNTTFLNVPCDSRELYPYIHVLDKSRKGFKVKRTNLSVMVDKEYNIAVKQNMVQVLLYDLANHDIRLWKNGKEVSIKSNWQPIYKNSNYVRFFTSIKDVEFKNMVSADGTGELFNMAWTELSNGDSWRQEKKLYRGLVKLFEYTYLEILANAGFPNVERFKERRSRYNTPTLNIEGKNPKEIFGLPKFCLKHIREDERIGIYEIKEMRKALEKIDGNRFRELLDIVRDEGSVKGLCQALDTLIEIHDTYGYNNLKKLTLYLFREIRMTQGITSPSTGATLLRDYIKMATKLRQEYDKYPKSLKKDHDVTMMNYKVMENDIKRREFREKVETEEYKYFEFKKKEYKIISPSEMEDLVREGNELSHCIASYIDRVIDNKCKIYFLRNVEDIATPLISIEVANENIRQVRGSYNRKATQEEKEFIKEWAEKKELVEAYY